MSVWRQQVKLIKDGEAVSAKTANRPLTTLVERTQYLKDRLDAASHGEGLILFSQTVSESVTVGDAVYYDTSNDVFQSAIAAAVDNDTGALRTADSAYVVGLVIRKLTTTSADILIYGRYAGLTLTDEDGENVDEGNYYLSAKTAGKLTAARPPVGIFVGTVTAQGILINPTPREVLEDHIHHKFELEVDPAGQPLCLSNDLVTLEYLDADREGWLPADHDVFSGTAPEGAKFGYNLWANEQLAALWPPQPTRSAYLELNGVGVAPELYRIDAAGLWWMSNCRDQVPWDAAFCVSSSIAPTNESSSSGSQTSLCVTTSRRMFLWFTRMVGKTDAATVTGLKSADGSPLTVEGCETPDAQGYCQGRLTVDLNMAWTREEGMEGSEVVKDISGNNTLIVGPVVEGVKGAGLISAVGTEELSGDFQAGRITLTGLDPTAITRQLDVALVALNGATESLYNELIPYVGLVSGRQNSFVGKIRIPQLTMVSPEIVIKLWFAMTVDGTPPEDVTIQYMVINAAPDIDDPPDTLPTAWSAPTDMALEAAGALSQGEYFAKTVLTAAISSEQIILFRVQRTASDVYNGDLAVISMLGTVQES